jgi:dephospho-CoA kinase
MDMRVAITGGVAEGKSTVLSYLQDLGWTTDSADQIAADVLHSDDVQQELSQAFDLTRPITAENLRPLVFQDPVKRRILNKITHPRILAKMRESTADFMEVPLLIESCLQGEFDQIWVVTCGPDEQLRRLTERLKSEEKARGIIASQLPTRVKIPFADLVIRTNQPPEDVFRFVTEAARRKS